jgi:hypothetical protein
LQKSVFVGREILTKVKAFLLTSKSQKMETNINKDIFELKFAGNGIGPHVVKPHEICELVIGFEKALLLTIKDQHPEIDTEQVLFSFDSIDKESLDLRFLPQLGKQIVVSSYLLLATSVGNGDYTLLSNDAITHLRTISRFAKKYECTGIFRHNETTISTITPATEIAYNKSRIIKEETTIFGKLVDIGGEKPNVHIKINEEYNLIFDTSEANVKKLATRIYEKVVLTGTVKWDSKTYKILDFKLNDIVDYSPGKSFSAIEKLRKLTSGFWDRFNNNDDINRQLLRD